MSMRPPCEGRRRSCVRSELVQNVTLDDRDEVGKSASSGGVVKVAGGTVKILVLP